MILLVLLNIFVTQLNADEPIQNIKLHYGISTPFNDYFSCPVECAEILKSFAQSASDLSLCSILHSRPIRLCEECINEYVTFRDKYQELLTKDVNGTSCGSLLMSQDRLNVLMDYHNNIDAVWKKGNCNACFDWKDSKPILNNDTNTFNKMYIDTKACIVKNSNPDNNSEVCEKCFDLYVQLDTFYKSLSTDSIGIDSICMDIVDSMNATRSIWSKKLNCCNLRRKPEIAFLCCASLISLLPVIYYLAVRFCVPIRDLPNVLKQSRFKQTIMREANRIINE